jgi:hypothetical protein
MSKRGRLVLVLVAISAVTPTVGAMETRFACKEQPEVKGPCFTKRGRLYVTNGIPIRIWVPGTKRRLAVAGRGDRFWIPDGLLELVDFDTSLYADFEICPLKPEKPGAEPIKWQEPGTMPEVCVAGGTKLVIEHWSDTRTRSWHMPDLQPR